MQIGYLSKSKILTISTHFHIWWQHIHGRIEYQKYILLSGCSQSIGERQEKMKYIVNIMVSNYICYDYGFLAEGGGSENEKKWTHFANILEVRSIEHSNGLEDVIFKK